MNPLTLFDLLGQPEFQAGFTLGIVALIAVLIVKEVGWLLVWGTAAIGALGWVGLLRWTAGIPEWGLAATIVTAIAATVAFWVLLRRVPAWSVGIVFALWVLGVWGTVPDTERAAVAMGVTAAMLPALWPGLRVRIGWEGALVAVAALGFVAITDGAPRPASAIGALGIAGMPIAAAVASRWLPWDRRPSPWWLAAAQVVHVIVSGRIASRMFQIEGAITIIVLSALVTGWGLAWAGRVRPGPSAPSPPPSPRSDRNRRSGRRSPGRGR